MSIYLSNERRLSWLLTGEALFFAFEPLNEAGKQYFEGNRCAQYEVKKNIIKREFSWVDLRINSWKLK